MGNFVTAFDLAWEMVKDLQLGHQDKEHMASFIARRMLQAADQAFEEEVAARIGSRSS